MYVMRSAGEASDGSRNDSASMPRPSASTMIWKATISFRAPEMRTTLPSHALLRARSGCSTASRSTLSPSFTAQTCLTSADALEADRRSAMAKRARFTR